MDFTQRLRTFGLPYGGAPAPGMTPQSPIPGRLLQVDPFYYLYGRHDPRMGFFHEEPKPSHSYIGLIAMAILNAKEKKLVLSDIYQWILDNYPYFRTRGPGWRNSIRHNLSLNDCFIKAGRAANGKGHYWAVHPAVEGDFEKGDFRRRRAQRKVRKAMGLAVPDEDDSPSPSPPPAQCSAADAVEWKARFEENSRAEGLNSPPGLVSPPSTSPEANQLTTGKCGVLRPNPERFPVHVPANPFIPWMNLSHIHWKQMQQNLLAGAHLLNGQIKNTLNKQNETVSSPNENESYKMENKSTKRRGFDVESLLAPDIKNNSASSETSKVEEDEISEKFHGDDLSDTESEVEIEEFDEDFQTEVPVSRNTPEK
jgi:hypothetical protein